MEFTRREEKSFIGLLEERDIERRIVHYTRRKNLPKGCISYRQRFSHISAKAAHQISPVRVFWPLLASRVR